MKNKLKMKQEKLKEFRTSSGITLIALIVTIIVLLILAGVSLNLVAGGNGILSKANRAVSATNKAQIEELTQLTFSELLMEYYSGNNAGMTIEEFMQATLKDGYELFNGGMLIYADGTYYYEDNNSKRTELDVDFSTGEVTLGDVSGTGEIAKYTVTYDASGGNGEPIDTNEYKRRTTVNVDFSTKPTKENYEFIGWSTTNHATNAQFTETGNKTFVMGNQNVTLYAVWEEIQLYNSKHPEKHIPTGFSHTEGTVDTGYVIKDSEGNEFVWIPVANDAAYAKKLGTNNWCLKEGSTGTETTTDLDSIENAIKGDQLGVTNLLGTTVEDTITAKQPEYPVVKKAGGFWVGRYEAGIESVERTENLVETKWDTNPGIIVKAQSEPARQIKQSQCLNIANHWKNGNADISKGTVAFQSGLITGSQWDAVCNFIGWEIADSSCVEWGNFLSVQSAPFTGLTSNHAALDWVQRTNVTKQTTDHAWVFPTGTFKTSKNRNTAQKNIFDIAGNVWEWTTEIPQYNEACAIIRGGSAVDEVGFVTGTYRYGSCPSATHVFFSVGFRIVLYVK